MKSVQPTTSKNKKESKKVNVEKEDNIFLSANKPNLTSLSIPTSITDNLEHAHEGVSSIGDPKSEILLDQNISNFLLPNKMTDSSNNCSPKYSVNKAAEKSPSKILGGPTGVFGAKLKVFKKASMTKNSWEAYVSEGGEVGDEMGEEQRLVSKSGGRVRKVKKS
ncbi:hypothetical protein TNCV_2714201 [Trichonephila clavipes]|nr:hypothetical protein TNCV_2714201 [Trichonephila clavipes]